MTDRLQEIRARMDDSAPVTITGPTPLVEAFQQKDADIAWLLAEVERLRRDESVAHGVTNLQRGAS